MRVICAPPGTDVAFGQPHDLRVVLYGRNGGTGVGSAGAAVAETVGRSSILPVAKAWDLLSIALSIVVADGVVLRRTSPDGWTREIQLSIAVADPCFWARQRDHLNQLLGFLTTDRWNLNFFPASYRPPSNRKQTVLKNDSVVLLSGGVDSLVGAVDLVAKHKKNPYAVSQIARGDLERQALFARRIGDGLDHIQFNHNAEWPGPREQSQRARSMIFLAYGVLMATALECFKRGEPVSLYICENGFIAVNPPLTEARLGSLSTRTAHPVFVRMFQELLARADLDVTLRNPYQYNTKGEMLVQCADQAFIRQYADRATSCGRFARNRYRHCGRCLPCLNPKKRVFCVGR